MWDGELGRPRLGLCGIPPNESPYVESRSAQRREMSHDPDARAHDDGAEPLISCHLFQILVPTALCARLAGSPWVTQRC